MAKKRNTYRGGPKASRFQDLFSDELQPQRINPQLINSHEITDKTLRAEYSRLRAIANKRLARMEGRPEAEGTYSRHPDKFPTVRGMDRAALVHALADVSHFLAAERGSLSGIQKTNEKIRESLEEKGINIPEDQLRKFGAFMNAMKKALGLKRGEYASGQAAKLWQELFQEGKISGAEFERRVKDLMKQADATPQQKKNVRKLMKENSIDTYFDDLSLDPRTIAAKRKRDEKPAEDARQARRKTTVQRRKRRSER